MRLLRWLIVLLALGGVFDSYLALRVHMQKPGDAPLCAVTENFDCGAVNHSRFAVFPPRSFDEDPNSKGHLPVAVAGIAGYLLIALLALLGQDFLTFESSQIGLFCALLLTFLEKYVLEKWCIYCLWSQGIIAAIFLISAINLWLGKRNTARAGLHIRSV